ncbi:hypothetical protein [Demequina sp.]|uniref:hypothetical protein n=1 Tax=Demequina sp. TaxID=2050685 RepID=UPI003D144730
MNGSSFHQPAPATAVFEALMGQRIPGGCEDCDAYQTVEVTAPGIYSLQVHHDATCPTYMAIVAARHGGGR